jgi:hypothetical protein
MTSLVVRSWWRRAVVALALLAAVAGATGGVAAGLLAGASRTRSAYDRFVEAAQIPEVFVDASAGSPADAVADAEALRAVPGVEGAAAITMGGVQLAGTDLYLQMGASLDGRYGREVNTGRMVAGREARTDAADEIVLPEPIATALGKAVGDRLRVESYTPAQIEAMQSSDGGAPPAPDGPSASLTVVGIQRMPTNVVTDKILSDQIILPVGFWREHGDRIGAWGRAVFADVGRSPSAQQVDAVGRRIRAMPRFRERFVDASLAETARPVQPTLDFVATGLTFLAGAIAFTGLIAIVLLLTRIIARFGGDASLLGALGATPRARHTALTLVAVPAAIGAGVVAAGAALATSAFVPFGLAERADPDPGLRLDLPPVVLGGLAVVIVVLIAALACAWRLDRRTRHAYGRRLGAFLHRGNSPTAAVGLTFAFDRGGHGRTGAGRGAVAGLAVAGAALVATFVFVASTTHLLDTPSAYGWTWDVQVNAEAIERVAAQPEVTAASVVRFAPVPVNGAPATVRGVRVLSGEPPLRLTRGRFATADDEVVLGAHSMDSLDVRLGDRITVGDGDRRRSFRVVGEGVFAGIEDVPFAADGGAIPLEQLEALVRGTDDEGTATGVVTLERGTDRAAFVRRVADIRGAQPEVVPPTPGADIERLGEADVLPWVLVAFLATVGVLSLAAAALSVVRRRRQELAVLRTIGFTRGDVRRTVVTQAVALTIAGLVIGIPVGLTLGRVVWRWFAGDLGVAPDVITPWGAIALFAVASVTVFALFSLAPAWAAARVRAAEALRTE